MYCGEHAAARDCTSKTHTAGSNTVSDIYAMRTIEHINSEPTYTKERDEHKKNLTKLSRP